jgi:hypothetical protein
MLFYGLGQCVAKVSSRIVEKRMEDALKRFIHSLERIHKRGVAQRLFHYISSRREFNEIIEN